MLVPAIAIQRKKEQVITGMNKIVYYYLVVS
jgi:hypothetical protein